MKKDKDKIKEKVKRKDLSEKEIADLRRLRIDVARGNAK